MKRAIGRVYGDKIEIGNDLLKVLGNPKEVCWVLRDDGSISVTKKMIESQFDFNVEKKQSTIMQTILKALSVESLTFNQLIERTKVSTRTLTKHLYRAKTEEFVKHASRKAPYAITEKGREFLKAISTKPTEEWSLEFVRNGSLGASIVLRIPKSHYETFSQLYAPVYLESLRKVMLLAFKFWGSKYSQTDVNVRLQAVGEDYNRDGVWDLTLFEDQSKAYPNVEKAIKEGRVPREFQFKLGLEALEFMLKTGLYSMRNSEEAVGLTKVLVQVMKEVKNGKDVKKALSNALGVSSDDLRTLASSLVKSIVVDSFKKEFKKLAT